MYVGGLDVVVQLGRVKRRTNRASQSKARQAAAVRARGLWKSGIFYMEEAG